MSTAATNNPRSKLQKSADQRVPASQGRTRSRRRRGMAQRVRQTMSRCWLAHSRSCSRGSTSASSRSMWHLIAVRVASTALHRSATRPPTSCAPRLRAEDMYLEWSAHRHLLENLISNLHLSVGLPLFRAPKPLFLQPNSHLDRP